MNDSTAALCELLAWDTDFFGCRIARVLGDTLHKNQGRLIDDWCRNNRVHGLYFLARADDPATIQAAEQAGFELTDIRVTFDHPISDSNSPTHFFHPDSNGTVIRPVQPQDLPHLQALARLNHNETRFFNDPHFPRHRAAELYSNWITQEVLGRAEMCFVAASEINQPQGYISCHLNPPEKQGQIGLIGVDLEVRGRGIGKRLVQAALNWYRDHAAQNVMVITQGKNLSAQRLYQKCGFLTQNLQIWYHKWYNTTD